MGSLDPTFYDSGLPKKKPSENRNLKIFGLGILVKRPEVFFSNKLLFFGRL